MVGSAATAVITDSGIIAIQTGGQKNPAIMTGRVAVAAIAAVVSGVMVVID